MSSIIYVGSGNGNSAVSQAFFDRLLTPPTGQREALYGQVLDAITAENVLLDGLFLFAAADNQTAFTNLIPGGTQSQWPQNIGTFTVDRGITCLGGTNNLDTLFAPSAGVNYTQNSACLFAWNLTTTDQPGYMLGSNGSVNVHISPHFADGTTKWAINTSTETSNSSVATDASGFWVVNRTGSGASAIYRNGTQLATAATTSGALDTNTIQSSTNNTCQLAVIGYGASLSAGQITALHNLLTVYLHGVGAV